jgi:alpha-L-rhamnosidase
MKKWLFYMRDNYLKEGILAKDRSGDWCMPPEGPTIINSKDPARQTDGYLMGTAYYYYCLQLMTKFAKVTEHAADIEEYSKEAVIVKEELIRNF